MGEPGTPQTVVRLGFQTARRRRHLNSLERTHIALRILGYALFPTPEGLGVRSTKRDDFFTQMVGTRLKWEQQAEKKKSGPRRTRELIQAEEILLKRSRSAKRYTKTRSYKFYQRTLLKKRAKELLTVAAIVEELIQAPDKAPSKKKPIGTDSTIPLSPMAKGPSLANAGRSIRRRPDRGRYFTTKETIGDVWGEFSTSAHLIAAMIRLVPHIDTKPPTITALSGLIANDLERYFKTTRQLQKTLLRKIRPNSKEPLVDPTRIAWLPSLWLKSRPRRNRTK